MDHHHHMQTEGVDGYYHEPPKSNFPETSTLLLPMDTLPIVIPQTSRALRGVYFSPFLRAYPETIKAVGISKTSFIRFIDDLNEAFISSPFFYGLMLAGTAASFVPEVAAQVVGGIVATASSFASTANSHVRTRLFVKAANREIFEPRGLQVRLLNTKKMLEAIHIDEAAFALPPLPEFNAPETQIQHEDPRRRWMQALDGAVSPLDYDAPAFSAQDDLLKKAGAWTAKKQDKKQARSLTKRREKAKKTIDAAEEEAVGREQVMQRIIQSLEADVEALSVQPPARDAKAEEKRQRAMAVYQKALSEEQARLMEVRLKRSRVTEKAVGKVDKKEHKVVQKIRWVVITAKTDEEEIGDVDIDDGVEDVHPLRSWWSRGSEE